MMTKENWNTFVLPEGVEPGDPVMELQLPLAMNPEARQLMAKIALGETEGDLDE